jgi:hypothetical protein
MHSVSSVLPLALIVFAASVNALGCYSGFGFDALHGGRHDTWQEVVDDINSRCQEVAGKTIKPNEPFWKCTNWAVTFSDHVDCFSQCMTGCKAIGTGPSAELGKGLCESGCDQNCDPGVPPNTFNHIDWAIEIRGNNPEKQITYEQCVAAFETEAGACHSGSEQNHDGFWFRIDPSSGGCP